MNNTRRALIASLFSLVAIVFTGCTQITPLPQQSSVDKLKSADTSGVTTTYTYDATGRIAQTQAVDDTTHAVQSTTTYTYVTGTPNTIKVVTTPATAPPTTTVITLNALGLGISDTRGNVTEYDANGFAVKTTTTVNGIITFIDLRTVVSGDIVTETRQANNPDTFNEIYSTIPYNLDDGRYYGGAVHKHWPAIHLDSDGTPPVYFTYEMTNGKVTKRTSTGSSSGVSVFTYY